MKTIRILRSRRTVFAALALMANVLFLDGYAQSPKSDQGIAAKIAQGKKLYQDGQYSSAASILSEALAQTPALDEIAELYLYLSAACFAGNDSEKSRANLIKYFELKPDATVAESDFPPEFLASFRGIKSEWVRDFGAVREEPTRREETPIAIGGKSQRSDELSKKQPFPWLLVGAGLVVVGIVVWYVQRQKNKPGPAYPILSVDPAAIAVDSAEGTASFKIVNAGGGGMAWTVEAIAGEDWLSVSPSSGSNGADVTISYKKNTTMSPRVGTLQVTAAGARNSPANVTLTQEGGAATPVLSVSPASLSVASSGGTASLAVTNAGGGTLSWTASVTTGASWLSISPASGTNAGSITATFTQNTGTDPRTGTIQVTAAGATGSPVNVTVTQAGASATPVLSVTPASLSAASSAGSASLAVTNAGGGTLSWAASVTSGSSWLLVSPASGTNAGTITVTYAQNTGTDPRTGTIQVTAAGASGSPVNVTVTQAGTSGTTPVLSVTPASLSAASSAGSASLAVTNSGGGTLSWAASVTSGGSWLSISPASGTNAGTIAVSYTQNTGTDPRSGTIQVTAAGATGSPVNVTVTQAGATAIPVLSVSPASISAASSAGSASLAVSNTGGGTLSWVASVTSGSTWLSILPTSGTNAGTIAVSYAANSDTGSRTGAIQVTASGATGSPVNVSVTQAGATAAPVLSVSPASISAASSAGSASLNVSNSGGGTLSWFASVTSGASWLSISPTSGTNAGTITVSYAANSGTGSRTGAIQVTASGATGSPANVSVTQGGSGNVTAEGNFKYSLVPIPGSTGKVTKEQSKK